MLYDIIALKITEYIALAVIVECTGAVLDTPWPSHVTGGGGQGRRRVSATTAAAAAVAGAAVTPEVAHSTLTQPMQCIISYSIYMHTKHDS